MTFLAVEGVVVVTENTRWLCFGAVSSLVLEDASDGTWKPCLEDYVVPGTKSRVSACKVSTLAQ